MSETQQLISGALTLGGMGGMPHDDRFFLGLAVLALVYGLLCAAIGAVIAHVKNQSVREGFLLEHFWASSGSSPLPACLASPRPKRRRA
jgi:hypothetical protein